ncbi:hypothetical protein SAMN04488503_2261 [Humidesulfovibrio mexicanus]|uniref:Uncharacterized protein n=1 Tax=Humidesulfovibrio mexicanus TaxID=147047 RepID=A0A239AWY5_9BACT|nr:hypothetical protein [Humidesulfovibrio mexicanus]SNR99842.1 hypothetical protein SAMN04488503_2261 [Humidesulfovibrio mexicanus]
MRYAQIKGGQKLHLVFEAGEGWDDQHLVKAGHVSAPICGRQAPPEGYRMTCNLSLGEACKNCLRVARAKGLR